jgi:predicted phage terminase large subunit-like protein
MPEHEARLLGYMVGDGACSGSSSRFTNISPELLDDFEHCAGLMGFGYKRRQRQRHWDIDLTATYAGRWTSRRAKSPLAAWKEAHGLLGATSYTKRVSDAVMTADKAAIANFLGAYWACDGTVTRAKRGGVILRADTVSRQVAEQVQHCLLRLGINASVRKKTVRMKTARQGDLYSSWIILIAVDSHTAFAKNIPIKHSEKARRIAEWVVGGAFDRVLIEDPVESIEPAGVADCVCIAVEEDESFAAADIAAHNSTLISQAFNAWDWIDNPEMQYLTASYARDLAIRDAVATRRIIESPLYLMSFDYVYMLSSDQNVKSRFDNTRGGSRIVTSTDSAAVGFGGNRRIVDDPINPREADSAVKIEGSIEWWKGTMSTRSNDPERDAVVVVHQRLNERDLTGYILGHEIGWEHLILPMRYEAKYSKSTSLGWKDPRTIEGELMFPSRLGETAVQEMERALGPYHVNAQLQQRPEPRGGIVFNRSDWKYYKALPELDEIVISVDCTFKNLQSSDHVAVQAWGNKGANKYLLRRVKERMNFAATVQAVRTMSALYPSNIAVLIEDKANGSAVIETLKSEIAGVIDIQPEGGKYARACAMQPEQIAGNIFLPDPSIDPKIEVFVGACASFTGIEGGDDDEVDAMTQYVNWRRVRDKASGLQRWMEAQALETERKLALLKLPS